MAVDKSDVVAQPLPGVPCTPDERSWVRTALDLQWKSLERVRAKYPGGSSMYSSVSADMEKLSRLKEKFA